MTLAKLESEISALSRAEKVSLIQRLAMELTNTWPGIEKTPGVVGGEARITRTRIPIWALVNYRRLGVSEAKLLDNYPTLTASDLVHAWAYADAHKDEIDQAILENESA